MNYIPKFATVLSSSPSKSLPSTVPLLLLHSSRSFCNLTKTNLSRAPSSSLLWLESIRTRTSSIASPFALSRSKTTYNNNVNVKWIMTSPVIKADAEMVDVTFVRSNGSKVTTKGKIGDNLLDVVVNNNVDLDGFGACEGTLACSTCHLVFKQEDFDKIQEKLTDEEMDMLDMAYGLTDTSRLGCQVCLTKALAGVEVVVPAGVNDARS